MRFLLLLLLLLPAACGDLPQPFRGNPGRVGAQLVVPLALRIAIPPPPQALLTDDAAKALAEELASALRGEEIPATASERPMPLDWQLDIVAEAGPRGVQPRFRLLDPDGREQGVVAGMPVSPSVWSNPGPQAFRPLALDTAKQVGRLLLQVDAARKQMDPVALAGGPARIRFRRVTGAPGDGNQALTDRMRDFLGGYGYVIQEQAEGATFGVTGRVNIVPVANNLQRVEIAWQVSRQDGEELGQVVQLNEVPRGTLDRNWGDIAYEVTRQAAGAVRQVLVNATAGQPGPSAAPAEPPQLSRSSLPVGSNPLAVPPSR